MEANPGPMEVNGQTPTDLTEASISPRFFASGPIQGSQKSMDRLPLTSVGLGLGVQYRENVRSVTRRKVEF